MARMASGTTMALLDTSPAARTGPAFAAQYQPGAQPPR